jgi:predicted transposase/invertase (TIGR01784 family)
MAMKALNRISQDEIMQIYYLNREIAQMDYNTGMYEAEKRGEQKGLEKGLQQGKLEIINKMLLGGLSPEQISAFTGLPLSEIENL